MSRNVRKENRLGQVNKGRQAMKLVLSVLLCCALGLGTLYQPGYGPLQVQAQETEVTGLTSMQIAQNMGYGINIGNSLECTDNTNRWNNNTSGNPIYNQETGWGNAIVTQELMEAIYAKGFRCVRVPVTWMNYVSTDGNYTIDLAWMNRVKEVVDYAYEAGLYVIINSHHDYWSEDSDFHGDYEQLGMILDRLWSQIAVEFADYDQRLVFEGMNEPTDRDAGKERDWVGDEDSYQVVNYLNQVFVNAVRKNASGHNAERMLMIQGYAASSDAMKIEAVNIPTYSGMPDSHLAFSAHSYDPYGFAMNSDEKSSGYTTTFNPTSEESTSTIDGLFDIAQRLFIDNGIPLIIGEAGAINKNNTAEREKWASYLSAKAAEHGAPIILWENGAEGRLGSECYGWINRKTYDWYFDSVLDNLFAAKANVAWGSATTVETENSSSYLTDVLSEKIWDKANGTAIDWSHYVNITPHNSYFEAGRTIAIVYTGQAPIFAMGSSKLAEKYGTDEINYWWMTLNASSTATLADGKKVAYFKAEDVRDFLATQNGCTPEDLSQISLTGGGATVYEIASTGPAVIQYKANGQIFYSGSDFPAIRPTYRDWEFIGWYTTPDYQVGTEFTSLEQATSYNFTVYAKFLAVNTVQDPSQQPTESTQESESEAEQPTKPTEQPTKPTEQPTKPTEQPTKPTEQPTKPKTPQITKVVNGTSGIQITWKKDSKVSGYLLYRSVGSGKYKLIKKITRKSTVKYLDKKVTKNGTRYRYKLISYLDNKGTLTKSKASKVVTTYRLIAPKIPSVKNRATKKAEVKWNANTKATGYEILLKCNSTKKIVRVTSRKTIKKTITKLSKGKTYTVSVRSYKTVNKKKYYSAYSKSKKIKISK